MGILRSRKHGYRYKYERFSTRVTRTDYVRKSSPEAGRPLINLSRGTTAWCDEFPRKRTGYDRFSSRRHFDHGMRPDPSCEDRRVPRPEGDVRKTTNAFVLDPDDSGRCIEA